VLAFAALRASTLFSSAIAGLKFLQFFFGSHRPRL
jgi:hypothetical protein